MSGPAAVDLAAAPTCLRYLNAWFRSILPKVDIQLVHKEQRPAFRVVSIGFAGSGFSASVEIHDGMADVQVNGMSRRIAFPRPEDSDLLREEFAILGSDPAFRRSLA